MSDVTKKTIDTDDILHSKLGDKTRYVPHSATRWFKRTTRQDEVNQLLWESKDPTGVDWLEACVQYLDASLKVEGRENLPNPQDDQLYIFASNHLPDGADGVTLGAIIGRHYGGRTKYLLSGLLMSLPGLRPLSISISKTGKQSRNSPAIVDAAFQSDNHVVVFPAGLCSYEINGQVRDIPWKKTFVIKSVKYQRDAVPIHFEGRNSSQSYRIANICEALELEFNVAMLLLVGKMYRNRHKTFRVMMNKPIPWQASDECKSMQQRVQYVQNKVYQLQPAQAAEQR